MKELTNKIKCCDVDCVFDTLAGERNRNGGRTQVVHVKKFLEMSNLRLIGFLGRVELVSCNEGVLGPVHDYFEGVKRGFNFTENFHEDGFDAARIKEKGFV